MSKQAQGVPLLGRRLLADSKGPWARHAGQTARANFVGPGSQRGPQFSVERLSLPSQAISKGAQSGLASKPRRCPSSMNFEEAPSFLARHPSRALRQRRNPARCLLQQNRPSGPKPKMPRGPLGGKHLYYYGVGRGTSFPVGEGAAKYRTICPATALVSQAIIFKFWFSL